MGVFEQVVVGTIATVLAAVILAGLAWSGKRIAAWWKNPHLSPADMWLLLWHPDEAERRCRKEQEEDREMCYLRVHETPLEWGCRIRRAVASRLSSAWRTIRASFGTGKSLVVRALWTRPIQRIRNWLARRRSMKRTTVEEVRRA